HRVVAGVAAERTVGAKSRDATVNQARKAVLEQLLVADSPALERAGLEVLHQHVRGLQESEQYFPPLWSREVYRCASFVAIDADEVRGRVPSKWRPPSAGLVALGRLDLDDVRTVVSEHLGAQRTAEHAGQVDHFDSGQRPARVLWFHRPFTSPP